MGPEDSQAFSRPEFGPRRSSAQTAASYIARLIFDGELRPGSRVGQEQIAELLGMSKVPVREALVALERDGWIHLEQHRGAFVNPITREGIAEHYQELSRMMLEYLLNRAARRQNPPVMEALRRIGAAFEHTDEPADALHLTGEFNAALIADMADLPRARMLLGTLQMSSFVPGNQYESLPETTHLPRRFLPGIVRSVEASDFDAIERAVGEMTAEMTECVIAHFVNRGVIGA
jgi:DNA-binding GntR family transcriptional regulator